MRRILTSPHFYIELFAFAFVAFLIAGHAFGFTNPTTAPGVGGGIFTRSGSNIGVDTATPGSKFTVNGTIESTSGGFKLPDGTILDDIADLGSGGGGGTLHMAKMRRDTRQPLSSSCGSTCAFDDIEFEVAEFDIGGLTDLSGGTTEDFVIQRSGKYFVDMNVAISTGDNNNIPKMYLRLLKNGSVIRETRNTGIISVGSISISEAFNFTAGDILKMQLLNTGFSNTACSTCEDPRYMPTMSVVEIGSGGGGGGTPSGAVMAFNLAACPTGWSELTSARGRYIVGLPSGGSLASTVGTALGNLENRIVGQHFHGAGSFGTNSTGNHSHANGSYNRLLQHDGNNTTGWDQVDPSGSEPSLNASAVISNAGSHAHSIIGSTSNAGSISGTNAPYLQLLYCEKD